jgi:vesicle coat complex subunit
VSKSFLLSPVVVHHVNTLPTLLYSTARGKVQELQVELQQADRKDKSYAKKKIALKKIVANMTMGNDSKSS